MIQSIKNFFSSNDFLPHTTCYLGNTGLVWLHLLSDLFIAIAYYSIPIILLIFIRRRKDLPFRGIFFMFSAFILACGTTHLIEIITLWYPAYWLSGVVKAATALLSIATALALIPLTPKALSLHSEEELNQTQKELASQIQKRRSSEDSLFNNTERLRMLLESVKDYAIFMLDPQGYITSWNPGAEKIKGYKANEIIGKHFSSFYTEKDLAEEKPQKELVIASMEGRFSEEGWRKRKDGTVFWASVVLSAIRDSQNNLIGFAKVTRDLTERKLHEEALEKSRDDLEVRVQDRTKALEVVNEELTKEMGERQRVDEALLRKTEELARSNKELEQFAYITSHDLQEPLYIISGFADTIKEQYGDNLDEKVVFLLTRMQNAAARMTHLIRDLLQFSRVNLKKNPFSLTDLNVVVNEVLHDLELRIKEANATVHVGVLPQVLSDNVQMKQLFQNLIGNAIKFRKKDVPPLITIGGRVEGNFYFLTVQDNGIGFEQEYSNKILEAFQRLHNRAEYEGSGLGLAICQKIVARHGGELSAHSVPQQGAMFTIKFPMEVIK